MFSLTTLFTGRSSQLSKQGKGKKKRHNDRKRKKIFSVHRQHYWSLRKFQESYKTRTLVIKCGTDAGYKTNNIEFPSWLRGNKSD